MFIDLFNYIFSILFHYVLLSVRLFHDSILLSRCWNLRSAEYVYYSRTFKASWSIFCRIYDKRWFHLFWWKQLLLSNSGRFTLIAAFNQFDLWQHFLKSTSYFVERARNVEWLMLTYFLTCIFITCPSPFQNVSFSLPFRCKPYMQMRSTDFWFCYTEIMSWFMYPDVFKNTLQR